MKSDIHHQSTIVLIVLNHHCTINIFFLQFLVYVSIEEGDQDDAVMEDEMSDGPGKTIIQ